MENLNLVNDTDVELLEALVHSAAFAALRRLIGGYQEQCMGILLTSKDSSKLFETQGRMIGSKVIIELPLLLTQQREKKRKEEIKKQEILEKKQKLARSVGQQVNKS